MLTTLILIKFSSQDGVQFASPGPLTQAHSHGETDCQMCHTEPGKGAPIQWFANRSDSSHSTNHKLDCARCHDFGENALNPHSISTDHLTALRDKSPSGTALNSNPGLELSLYRAAFDLWSPQGGLTEVECARCHQEHQGRFHDIKSISTTQCQICHQKSFSSFSKGHPQFGNYPFTKRSRIIFNHQSHLDQHFKSSGVQGEAARSCLTCHTIDDQGAHVNLRSFSQTCAQCHEDEIVPGKLEGTKIALIRIPWIDVDSFDSEGESIGEWPDDWDSLETTLAPASMLLLNSSTDDKLIQEFWEKDWDGLEPESLQNATQLLWSLKGFVHGIHTNGVGEITKRLAHSLGRSLSPAEEVEIANSFPHQAVQEMFDAWFPKLADEISRQASGGESTSAFTEEMEDRLSFDLKELAQGWIRSDIDMTLYYQPTHHEDAFMKLLLEASRKSTVQSGEIFNQIAGNADSPKAGRCLKCHSQTSDNTNGINWTSERIDPEHRPFTRFSHVAHFRNVGMLDNNGCYTCHPLNIATDRQPFLEAFRYFNPKSSGDHIGNFTPIKTETCAQCHVAAHAGDNCLTCHNYHVGKFPATDLPASLYMRNFIP